MQYLTGREALRLAIQAGNRMETEEGMIVYPDHYFRERCASQEPAAHRLPEFVPASPQEAYLMGESARLYAESYGTAILIRLVPEVAEGKMLLRPIRRRRIRCGYERNGRGKEQCTGIPCRAFSDSGWNCVSGGGRKGIWTYGPGFLRVREILNGSAEVRILKLGTVWPFPEELICRFLQETEDILVLDETRRRILTEIYAIKGKYELRCRIHPFYGEEERADDIAGAMTALMGREAGKHFLPVVPPVERSMYGLPILPC